MTEFDFGDLGEELQDFGDDMQALAQLLSPAIDRGIQKTALQVERTAKQRAPVDTGTLRKSIGYRDTGELQYAVGSSVKYAPHVEFGTAPHMPPVDELRDWANDHNADAWALAMHIKQEGTPAQPFLRPALKQHQSDLVENIQAEIDKTIAEVMD